MRKGFLAVVLLLVCPILSAQQAQTNDSIIKMVKAGLSDDLIVTTINGTPGNYNTSADGLIALKGAGVSDKIVAAMVARANAPATPAPVAAPMSSGLPAGIDEVGVYLKDKTGAWIELMPEIVNFKTGGALKSFATNGIIKQDMNGHVAGPKGKTTATFPVVFAVYVPEGTAITEYQLLRLRPNGDSREFRSVTGGVVHTSGGAIRDSVEFKGEKDRAARISGHA